MSRLVSPATFAALSELETCSVANAIECFDVRLRNEGFTDATIQCRLPALPPMLGYALTLRVRSSSPSWKGDHYLDRTDWWSYVEAQPGPHVLVIQDMDRHPGTGSYIGEVHAAILKALGTVGAITNGAVRDLRQVERLAFRMFSASISVSHAYTHIVEFGGAVEVAGLHVTPGDLLHGDMHGVVKIPLNVADRIPEAVVRIKKHERQVVEFCRSGEFSLPGLRKIAGDDPCRPRDGFGPLPES
jgi:regulator of RNase E activity RraA